MRKLEKIGRHNNTITWFEIPVHSTERARAFYEAILQIGMSTRQIPGTDEELTFFPHDPEVLQATSGRVTGALSRSASNSPGANGTLVYLNASPRVQDVLDRVEGAGGRVLVPRIPIPAGYIAVILDTEGNRVGLHAEE